MKQRWNSPSKDNFIYLLYLWCDWYGVFSIYKKINM